MSALAVDVGTSVVKAVAFADDGTETALVRRTTRTLRPNPGWAEQDMDAVWQAVLAAVRGLPAEQRAAASFLAITGQGDGCWLVDDAGRPTGPAVLWSDGRAGDIVERWRTEGVLAEAFTINGSLGFSGLPHAILAWLAGHDPERLRRSATALSCDGWVFSQLTNRVAVDRSDASAPFLDIRDGGYSARLRQLFGLEWAERLLPPVLDGADRVATLTPQAAAALGLPADLPVVMAPYDLVSTAVGAGAVAPGQGSVILGTTLCAQTVRDTVDTSGEAAGLTIGLDGGQVLRAFPTLAGTEVLTWAGSLLGVDHPADFGRLAAAAPPGSRGLLFLPYLSPAGERAPFLDPAASGSFWRLTLEHTRADVARAVLEGLTHVIRDCLRAAGIGTTEIRLCGGGARGEVWRQLIADVTGVPVVSPADSEVGAKGAFLAGLVATGAVPDLATAADRYVRLATPAAPDPVRAGFYAAHHEEFRQVRELASAGWQRIRATPTPWSGSD